MIQEAYCSKEVSELLREKGFDEKVGTYYLVHPSGFSEFFDKKDEFVFPEVVWLKCPTHQMAMAWLREVYNLFICIEFDAPTFVADIYKMDEIDEHGCAKHIQPTIANCKAYEEAVEAALKYCLENIV